MRYLPAVLVAVALAVVSLAAQSPATSAPGAAPGWKVPRTPDGHADLQGVWGNNSVTPMTRPTQWKDKAQLTDAELEDLKQFTAKFIDQGGDAIFGNFVQLALDAKDKGAFNQVSYDPTTGNYNQFWMADREWDHRTSLIIDPPDGQYPAADARGRGPARGGGEERARGAGGARSGRRSRRPAAVGALHLVRRAAHRRQLQQLRPDHPVARDDGAAAGDDSRRARRADDAQAAPAVEHPPAARRSARPLGRRHAGGRDHELHQRLPGLDAEREDHRALHARQPRLHQLGSSPSKIRRRGPSRTRS